MKVFDLISMNSEQADIIGLARQICEKELLPHVAELDREGRYPVEDIGVTPLICVMNSYQSKGSLI